MILKACAVAAALTCAFLGPVAAAATTTIDFESIPEGTIASDQFTGLTITGGSVLTQDSRLNPRFPPHSGSNIIFNYLDGEITLDFTTPVDFVGGYVTGGRQVVLYLFNGPQFDFLGSVRTNGSNFVGTGRAPNQFLQFSAPSITRATFSNNAFEANSFTVDDLTIGGTIITRGGAVPEPATWALLITGFGAAGAMVRRRNAALGRADQS
jgi:hypothetical protein